MTERVLIVYLDQVRVGCLEQNPTTGVLRFAYDAAFLDTAQTGISLSLPLQKEFFEGRVVQAFFSGILPEMGVRERIARQLGISSKNTFALLREVGGECAGALTLYPEGQDSDTQAHLAKTETLDDTTLSELLALIKRRPLLVGEEGFRLSLAGAQDKLPVGFEDGRVVLILGDQPTTHILKPAIDSIADSVYNELFCMRLAREVGIEVPFADIHFVNDTPYYLVERYDRVRQKDGTVTRLHQEDFCQALGIPPEFKYENEGGPGITACQTLIKQHVARPAVDQIKFLEIIIFNYLIGNADAHGKNFSLLYHAPKPELAPAYDLLCTEVYPDLSKKMAMKIGGKYQPEEVLLRHWHRLIPETRAAQNVFNQQLKKQATETLERALALKETLAAEGLRSKISSDICEVVEKRSRRLHRLFEFEMYYTTG